MASEQLMKALEAETQREVTIFHEAKKERQRVMNEEEEKE